MIIGQNFTEINDIDHTFFTSLETFLNGITDKYKVYLIIGGGKTARRDGGAGGPYH